MKADEHFLSIEEEPNWFEPLQWFRPWPEKCLTVIMPLEMAKLVAEDILTKRRQRRIFIYHSDAWDLVYHDPSPGDVKPVAVVGKKLKY